YVREMALAPPPTSTAATRPPVAPRAARNTGAPLPRRLAQTSAPVVPDLGEDVVEDVVPAATNEPSPDAVAQAASSAAASAANSATVDAAIPPTAAAVEQVVDTVWPQTTRVSYAAHGYYRGEIHGSATVEWIRLEGDRYRMHMDVRAGAGAFRWSTSSSGRITAQGVWPERFEQTRGLLFSNKHLAVTLGEQHIEFANGQQAARPADVQDINSQFVQLTYLFTTRQELTAPGQQVAFPLAFERGLRSYAYQVKGHEVLQTPLGAITTVHAVPQRLQAKDKDLVAQAWFAPQLHYLPIRIHITQGDETFIELNISKAPELAR
ncbi:MAG: DUF3108 domain-containing protein, partial [Burkholderiales bacterium]